MEAVYNPLIAHHRVEQQRMSPTIGWLGLNHFKAKWVQSGLRAKAIKSIAGIGEIVSRIGIVAGYPAQPIRKLQVQRVRQEASAKRHVMPEVRSPEEIKPAGPENPGDLLEMHLRIRNVFEHVIGYTHVKALRCKRESVTVKLLEAE